MAYKKRTWLPLCFYHVICRGNRREPIFLCKADMMTFFHILNQIHEKYPFELASYCIMSNHYHLQIRSKEVPLSKIMSLINKRYANYYNTRYQLTGHVFEKRYYDKVIEDRKGMLEVSRYIHLNPVKANMVNNPESYPWSSYYLFKHQNHTQPKFMDVNHILDFFTGTMQEKREQYCQAHMSDCV